ncbi:MAG: peptide MFS transporter [Acidobacteriota bacterium]
MTEDSTIASGKTFFGHPRGLSTLFFTEIWERFSYYGMRPLLILYMTKKLIDGGMGLSTPTGTAIVGLYTFGVYALALPGGWIADRLMGQRRAVLLGGLVIAAGHYTLAVPATWAFYTGLLLVVLGTGLLKPNVSAIVGDLYSEDEGARRDAGFTIFYMGINIGAAVGPLICGWLFQMNPHWGFGAAGVGMTFGLIQYVMGQKYLGAAGHLRPAFASRDAQRESRKKLFIGLAILVAVGLAVAGANASGAAFSIHLFGRAIVLLPLTLVSFAQFTGFIVFVLAICYFSFVIIYACRDTTEKKRVALIAILFVGAALFWSGFEQASTAFNLFARDQTDLVFFGWQMPVTWLQSVNPLFIVALAPVVGSLWVMLGAHNPSIGAKFGYGLVLMGTGFFVLAWGSTFVTEGSRVSPMWLVMTYFFHTVGELSLSPVGLSSVTKLAPERLVGQMMGTWFMGAALGNLMAGLLAGYIESMPQAQLFGTVAAFAVGTGVLFFVFKKPIRWLGAGIE